MNAAARDYWRRALEALGDAEVFVTLTMNNVPLRKALTVILKPHGLDFAIWNQAILTSTQERIEELTRNEINGK